MPDIVATHVSCAVGGTGVSRGMSGMLCRATLAADGPEPISLVEGPLEVNGWPTAGPAPIRRQGPASATTVERPARGGCGGVYGSTVQPGRVAVGDAVVLVP